MLEDDLDGKPYDVSKLGPACPQCTVHLADGTAVCPACGFRLTPEPDAKEQAEPLKRQWDASPPSTRAWGSSSPMKRDWLFSA